MLKLFSDLVSDTVTGFGINDVFDILITAFVIYKILGFIRESRAEQLVQGLILLVLAVAGAFLTNKANAKEG